MNNGTQEILENLQVTTLHQVIRDLSKVGNAGSPKAGRGKNIDWFLLDAIELYNSKVPVEEKIEIIEIED